MFISMVKVIGVFLLFLFLLAMRYIISELYFPIIPWFVPSSLPA